MNELIPTEFVSRIAIAHRVSAAELKTLQLALQGYSTADIGIELGLSGVAVRKRLGEVYKKFQIPGDGPGKLTELKHRLLERYESHGPNRMGVDFRMSPAPIEGQVPDVPAFYGREEELARLRDWIVSDRTRLVALAGTGKIGKTALAVKLAQALPSDFDRVIWRSLRDAPPPAEFLAEAIEELSGSPPASQTPGKQISQLIECFCASRCLLVLDDIEHLFVPGQLAGYRQGYQDYGELLRRVGELNHRSCLVAIAQELPLEVSLMAGNLQPVRVLPLGGLSEAAGRELIAGILGGNNSQCDKIDKLVADCGGNPLLLRLASQKTQDVFEGDLDLFIKYNEHFFGKFHKLAWMGEWLDLLFGPVFERLAPEEKALLNRAILMAETIYLSRETQSLERRSLLEKTHHNGIRFDIDPAFRQFLVEKMMAGMADILNSPDVGQSDILRAVGFQDFEIRDNQNFLEKTVGQKIGRLFNQMGYRKFMKGEYITAKSYWLWAIQFHPQLGAAHFNLGSIYDNLQEIDLAKEHYNLAKNYQAKGKYSAASNLARLEILAGNSEAAIASISPILDEVEIDSIRAALLKNLGWAYFAQGRHSEAEEQLKEAIALEPSSVAAYYLLAQVKEAAGEEQTALDYWREGLHISREKTKLKDESWKYPEFKQWETEAKRRVDGIEETELEEDIIPFDRS
ncbi:tetratricopeptide repeat protein [Lyngbya sp. CCY1209]|uniref:tetratricopeptide repeat protein n=1 Tax=Lyngbya sp. CCY1209 TaxID=2886103 RepID=UPI002D2009BB|nr:tetratricopeptide repeat protein [Lyngbya sp. CCY1209]MEB3884613.1 tetratricopeptide repeat protein [Lyngbya sp. CCY1209]